MFSYCSQTHITCNKHVFHWMLKFCKVREPRGSDYQHLSHKVLRLVDQLPFVQVIEDSKFAYRKDMLYADTPPK